MKLAIIDLDGVVANVDARFQAAELAKEQWLMARQQGLPYANDRVTERSATDVYWRAVFDPAQVQLDTPIEGAADSMAVLAKREYEVIMMTSRPESMREVTRRWLFDQDIPLGIPLVMKSSAFQYVKTVVWKAGMIQHLAAFYGAMEAAFIGEVLVVDDEAANRDHLATFADTFAKLVIVESLAQAVAYARDGTLPGNDDHPF